MGLFPWVFVGSLIGSIFIVPMIPKIMDVLFYKDKYNNRASDVYQKYIDSCFTIKVVMPSYNLIKFYIIVIKKDFLWARDLR